METEALANGLSDPEEGEIENGEDVEIYVPLERPHIPTTANPSSALSDTEDNLLNHSSSDSDSSTGKSSASKIKKKLVQPTQHSAVLSKKKSYNIWCADLQTEVLTSNLVDCNVDQSKERTRDVESYDYRIGAYFNDSDRFKHKKCPESQKQKNTGFSSKRNYDGHYVEGKKKGRQNAFNSNPKTCKGSARKILALTKTVNDTVDDIAKDIANKLCEEKENLIQRALSIAGKEAIISLFEKTKAIEEDGGMLIMNGMRRRTPGGVFFFLLKSSTSIPQDEINLIFADDRRITAAEKKKTAKEMRKIRTAKLKESLKKDDFPTLLSRTELAIKQYKARKSAEESAEVKNPPPSPATDCRENSSDGDEQKFVSGNVEMGTTDSRSLTSYDDDLFGGGECDMEVA